MDVIVWVILVVASGFALTLIINRLLARLNVHPVDPEERPGGLPEIAGRIERWAQDRQRSQGRE